MESSMITTTTTAASKAIKKRRENQKFPINSPNTTSSTINHITNKDMPLHIIPPPSSSKAIFKSEPELYSTIYIQADTGSFKQVVQFLTGSSQPTSKPDQETPSVLYPEKVVHRKQAFKLYETRNNGNFKSSSLMINIPMSSSSVDLPKYDNVSPVTPLSKDAFDNSDRCSSSSCEEEEKAIAEKGFYLHPSLTTRGTEPRLLPLFPVSSLQGFSLTS